MTGNKILTVIIILLLSVLPAISQESDIINFTSGSYNNDILIKIQNYAKNSRILYGFNQSIEKPDVPYQGGFLLSALKGEERSYDLRISIDEKIYEYSFLIDRNPPEQPEAVFLSKEDGSEGYSFIGGSGDSKIFYGYDEYQRGAVFQWDGELLSIPKTGFIYYYSEDGAGNRSENGLLYLETSIGRTNRSRLEIKSPVEGDFANPQLLYIEKAGYEWIKYALNGLDPAENGAEYKEPVEIRRYGNVNLKIAAKPFNSDEIIRNEINYRVNTRAPLKNIPSSGIYSTGINIKSNFNDFRYCLEERSPIENDHVFIDKLSINPIYGGVKYITFRIKDFSNSPEAEFRYFYVIDDRFPASPVIDVDSALPANKDVTVDIAGPEYSEIYYTTDGSTPSAAAKVYEKPFILKLPAERNAGSYIIKARAVSLNNKSSEVITKLITYDTKAPEKPEVRIVKSEIDGIYNLVYELKEGERLFYCIDYDEECTTEIDNESFFLDIPEGMENEFRFVFFAEDATGNRSEASDELIINIDKKPPVAASVSLKDSRIIIESDEAVEYRYKLLDNGALLETGSGFYDNPLEFSDKSAGAVLNLNVRTSDDSGNTNFSNYNFSLSEQLPNGGTYLQENAKTDIYNGDSVSFNAHPDGIGEELFYYLTEIVADGEKITDGPFSTDGDIVILGTSGEKKEYMLEVYSVNKGSGKKSKVSSTDFIIDNEKPSVPEISGILNDTVSSGKIAVSPVADEDAVVYLVYAENEEDLPPVFSNSAIIFSKDIVFDVDDGFRKDFYLMVGAEDSAGNRTVNDKVYNFTIDRERPKPDYELVELQNKLIIHATDSQPFKYHFERGLKGGVVKDPDQESPYFTDELTSSSPEGKNESSILKIVAYDEAGNRAMYSEVFYITINNNPPETPAFPEAVLFKENRKLFVSWENQKEGKLYYSISDDEKEEAVEYFEYSAPFSLKYDSSQEVVAINFYKQDDSGNRSETVQHLVRIPNVQNTDLVEGIKNNQFYNMNLQLKKLQDKKIIRYEISTYEIIPPEVTVFSPVLPDPLEFKTEEGESIDFLVSLKEFQDSSDQVGGAEQVLRFTIDKQPPSPPEIDGIMDKEYYLSDQKAYFKASEGDIYYSLTSTGSIQAEQYSKYIDSFDISSADGTYQSFLISAYSQDYAGNRSTQAEWNITIDKEIIYVSPDGQDYSEGTRSRPYRTLNKAVEQVKNSNRKTIFISSGSYFINSPVIIDEDITIYGGFNSRNWFEKEGETIIYVGDKITEGNPVFYVYGGNLNLNQINIKSEGNYFDALFFINKGDLNINNIKISADCTNNKNLIRQNYGNLFINNSEITGITSNEALISTDYGLVTINNSILKAEAGDKALTLIEVKNSINFTAAGSKFLPGAGENIAALKFINSSVNLKNNTVNIGTGSVSANAIEVINSKMKMKYCRVSGNKESRLTSGITVEDSQIELYSNNFNFTGNNGIIGFKMTGGDSIISGNSIFASSCTDFSYMFLINGGSHAVETNIIEMESAEDTVMMRSRNADIDFLQNTMWLTGGKARLVVFSPEQNSVSRIINNIIVNKPTVKSSFNSLVFSAEDTMLSLKNNCFSGWDYLFSGSKTAENLISLDLLDGIYSAGQYSNNIEELFDESFMDIEGSHLSSESECIDTGYDLSEILKGNNDFDGERRPNPLLNRDPAFDIGADEYYE